MYKKITFTENTLQVLSLFTNDFNKEYYVREVQKLLKISPRTAQLILEDLEDKGVIESKTKGKIKTFKLNPGELNFTEDSLKARIDSQYYIDKTVPDEQYNKIIQKAPEFLVKCKSVIIKLNEKKVNEIRDTFQKEIDK